MIISSDATRLSNFGGDKSAWPVYLTIGNIQKSLRRQSTSHANVLIGYLPTSKLEVFHKKTRGQAGWRVFHHCMRKLLEPLREAGKSGVTMVCADGYRRRVYPILAAYVADYPEQITVACCLKGRCPKCLIGAKELGQPVDSILRDPERTKQVLKSKSEGFDVHEFKEYGLRPIYKPFWAELPHCDIFNAITPDILHQLHKGVFKDHLVTWCMEIASEAEIDERFKAMVGHPGLRHFKKGISQVEQWTGKEMKEMQKMFGCILPGAVQARVVKSVHAVLDFIYYAQLESHTESSLNAMQAALDVFDANKDIFITLGTRQHFNIPKIHSMRHYIEMIKSHGALDGYNTETSERLHIDFAKNAYRASNKRDYLKQMALWLQRQEAIHRFDAFLEWLGRNPVKVEEEEVEESDDEEDVQDTTETDLTSFSSGPGGTPSTYHLPKGVSHPNTSVDCLVTKHEATNFLPALSKYLVSRRIHTKVTDRDRFDVYNQVTLRLPRNPAINNKKRLNRVRATPAVPDKPGKKGRLANFDTALVRDKDQETNEAIIGTGLQGVLIYSLSLPQY